MVPALDLYLSDPVQLLFPVMFGKKRSCKHVSCEFDELRVDSRLCKLRGTPAARWSYEYGCCQGEHEEPIVIR